MQGKPLSSTNCKYFFSSLNLLRHPSCMLLKLEKHKPTLHFCFIQSNEWGGPYFSHHWKQCGRNSGEEHPLFNVGHRWAGVSQIILEHLLLQHRGEKHLSESFTLDSSHVLSSTVFSLSTAAGVCSEHRRQQRPPKSKVTLFTKGPVWETKGSAATVKRKTAEADVYENLKTALYNI